MIDGYVKVTINLSALNSQEVGRFVDSLTTFIKDTPQLREGTILQKGIQYPFITTEIEMGQS